MKSRKTVSLLLLTAIILSSLASCAPREEPKPQARSYFEYFDTVSVVFSYLEDSEEDFLKNCERVASILEKYHRLFDIYYTYSGMNNLRTVNKNAGGEPVSVEPELIEFLLYSKEIYALTEGKVNIAIGAVTKLWHDCREFASEYPEDAAVPSAEALAEAAKHTDIEKLIIDEKNNTVQLLDPEMSLDVGALGKGYATERAAELLISLGVTSYVLNIGGNIRAIGERPSGKGWSTGITNPDRDADDFAARVVIKDTSLVTSGDYERYYTVDGVKYHHIIDPETLYPSNYFSSVSVFIKDSALADALSTALFSMNYEDGRALADSVGAEVIWITGSGEIMMTDGVPVE